MKMAKQRQKTIEAVYVVVLWPHSWRIYLILDRRDSNTGSALSFEVLTCDLSWDQSPTDLWLFNTRLYLEEWKCTYFPLYIGWYWSMLEITKKRAYLKRDVNIGKKNSLCLLSLGATITSSPPRRWQIMFSSEKEQRVNKEKTFHSEKLKDQCLNSTFQAEMNLTGTHPLSPRELFMPSLWKRESQTFCSHWSYRRKVKRIIFL